MVREAEQYLGYEHGRIVSWCERGLLKAISFMHNYRIPKMYVIDFIAHMEGNTGQVRENATGVHSSKKASFVS